MKFRRLAGFANLLAAGALLLVAWALVTLLASRPLFKHLFDLTPQARATVSKATVDLIDEVRRQELKLEFHLFFQPRYSPPPDDFAKAWWDIDGTLQTLTRDLLRQYAYLGGDTVKVRDYNLDTEIEAAREAAQKYSVPRETDTVVVVLGGRHKKLSLRLDLGDIDLPQIQATAGPARRTVPTLRDFTGEEALTSAIKSLLISGKPVVYFLAGYSRPEPSLDGSTGGDYSNLRGGLEREGFTVKHLALKQQNSIPEDATALALLEPQQEFTEAESDLLMGYLRRGGRLFVDYAWHPLADHNPTGLNLGRRLGFELTRDPVFQKSFGADGQRLDGNPAVMNLVCLYNPKHPVTGPLSSTSRLSLKLGREFLSTNEAPKGVHLDALARTDEQSWIARSRPDPTGSPLFDYVAPRLPNALAPRDVGIVADVDGEQKGVEGHVVLLAGYAFNNIAWMENRDFALNIFNWMADRKVLVSVPGDRYHARRVKISLDQLDNIWMLMVIYVPGFFLVLGLLVFWRRSMWK